MTRRLKLMTGLSTVAAAGVLGLAGCGGEGEGESEASSSLSGDGQTVSGEAEGDSEGGEGESENAAASGDPSSDDVEYLRLLGLVRGHLIAFLELYNSGATEMAMTHVKHPESELYTSLAPAVEARGKPGFAAELSALAAAAEAGGDVSDAFSDVISALSLHAGDAGVAAQLLGVSEIVRTAADEFDIGVEEDGTISNVHEYQDAFGFLVASREILSGLATSDVNEAEAIDIAQEQISFSLDAFHSLTASESEGKASTIYGAAARIEIAARGLL